MILPHREYLGTYTVGMVMKHEQIPLIVDLDGRDIQRLGIRDTSTLTLVVERETY